MDVAEHLPQGIRETQLVHAIANGSGESVATLEFITAVSVPFPNIVFTAEGWEKVRDKAEKYDWAKEGFDDYVRKADKWKAPKAADFSDVEGRPLGKSVFHTSAYGALDCGIAYQLTGNEEYVTKCLELLRQLADPKSGYPATLVGGSNSFVGEGKFWQSVARMYDLIRTSPQVTEEDKK